MGELNLPKSGFVVSQILKMKIKLLAPFNGTFPIKPFQFCIRLWKAFDDDIFFTFVIESDPFTMMLTLNHFENMFSQLRHLGNFISHPKTVKVWPWALEMCLFYYRFCRKCELKQSKLGTPRFLSYSIPYGATQTQFYPWFHDEVIKWKHFPRYWPFVRGIHRWIPHIKASDAEPRCFVWSGPE